MAVTDAWIAPLQRGPTCTMPTRSLPTRSLPTRSPPTRALVRWAAVS